MTRDSQNLQRLATLLQGQGYEHALPTALSDDWLLVVGRELRRLEQLWMDSDASADDPALGIPVLLVTHVLRERSQWVLKTPIELSVEDAPRIFNKLQFLVEREIVGRAVGIAFESDVAQYLADIDQLIEEAVRREEASGSPSHFPTAKPGARRPPKKPSCPSADPSATHPTSAHTFSTALVGKRLRAPSWLGWKTSKTTIAPAMPRCNVTHSNALRWAGVMDCREERWTFAGGAIRSNNTRSS